MSSREESRPPASSMSRRDVAKSSLRALVAGVAAVGSGCAQCPPLDVPRHDVVGSGEECPSTHGDRSIVSDFDSFCFMARGISHTVYVKGTGPAVLLLHELNGLSPMCIDFAREIAANGFAVYMPLLFGEAG